MSGPFPLPPPIDGDRSQSATSAGSGAWPAHGRGDAQPGVPNSGAHPALPSTAVPGYPAGAPTGSLPPGAGPLSPSPGGHRVGAWVAAGVVALLLVVGGVAAAVKLSGKGQPAPAASPAAETSSTPTASAQPSPFVSLPPAAPAGGWANGAREAWRLNWGKGGKVAAFWRGNALVVLKFDTAEYRYAIYDYSAETANLRFDGKWHGSSGEISERFQSAAWVGSKLVVPDPREKRPFVINVETGEAVEAPWGPDYAIHSVSDDSLVVTCRRVSDTDCRVWDENLQEKAHLDVGVPLYYFGDIKVDGTTYLAFKERDSARVTILDATSGRVTRSTAIPENPSTNAFISPLADSWLYEGYVQEGDKAVTKIMGYLTPTGVWWEQSKFTTKDIDNRYPATGVSLRQLTKRDFEAWLAGENNALVVKFLDDACTKIEIGPYQVTLPDTGNSIKDQDKCIFSYRGWLNIEEHVVELHAVVPKDKEHYQSEKYVHGHIDLKSGKYHEIPGAHDAYQQPQRTRQNVVFLVEEDGEVVAYVPRG